MVMKTRAMTMGVEILDQIMAITILETKMETTTKETIMAMET